MINRKNLIASKMLTLLTMMIVINFSKQKSLVLNENMFEGYFEVGMDGVKENPLSPVTVDDDELSFEIKRDSITGLSKTRYSLLNIVHLVYTPDEDKIIFKNDSGNDEKISKNDLVLFVGPNQPLSIPIWAVPNEKKMIWGTNTEDIRAQLLDLMDENAPQDDFDLPFNQIPMEKYTENLPLPDLVKRIQNSEEVKKELFGMFKKYPDPEREEAEEDSGDFGIFFRPVDPLVDESFLNTLKTNLLEVVDKVSEDILELRIVKKVDDMKLGGEDNMVSNACKAIKDKVRGALENEDVAEATSMFGQYNRTSVEMIQKCANEVISQKETMTFFIMKYFSDMNLMHVRPKGKTTVWVYLETYTRLRIPNFLNEDLPESIAKIFALIDESFQEIYGKINSFQSELGFDFQTILNDVEIFHSRLRKGLLSKMTNYTATQNKDVQDPVVNYTKQEFIKNEVDPSFAEELYKGGIVNAENILSILSMAGLIQNSTPSDSSTVQILSLIHI